MLFLNGLNTDGFNCDFLFCRSAYAGANRQLLELGDFTLEEVRRHFRPLAVDTGIRNLFTAAYGSGSGPHETRNFSSAEWHANAGSKRRNAEVQAKKEQAGISEIESQWPSSKTANLFGYRNHLKWYFLHRLSLLSFYDFERAKERFQAYQGKQKALEEATNVLVNGGKKYNPERRRHTDRNRTLGSERKKKKKKKKKQSKLAEKRYSEQFLDKY
jgi:hypothetical protein